MIEKRGFTLIELLAVIVILAVIAVIAVPIIQGIIDNAKKGAAEASIYGYIDAVKQNVALGYASPEGWVKIPEDNELTSGNDDDDAILANILVNGTNPDYITVQFSNQKIVSGGFCIDGYNIEYDGKKVSQSSTNYCQFANIKTVTIDNAETSIFESETLQLNVTSDPEGLTPTYSSSDVTIATVSSSGLVTAIKNGTVTITARIGIKKATFILTVIKLNDSLVGKTQSGIFANDSIQTIVVNGVTYAAHVYNYNGDQTWSGNMTFGTASDVGTSSTNASNMVIVKVNGNLTINSGVTVTTYSNTYGGPKGLLLYVSGTLTNNGTITMSGKGAKAAGQNVYLWKNENSTYEYVPAAGASGATAVSVAGAGLATAGNAGGAGTARKTGGGGGGGVAVRNAGSATTSSTGGAGNSYAGGGGGGGTARHSNGYVPTPNNATAIAGSAGSIWDGSYSTNKCATGGGAGIPAGTGLKSSSGISGFDGTAGSGGLLIVYANEIVLSSTTKFTADGQNGGNSVAGGGTGDYGSGSAGGGGSGGGTINIFAQSIVNNGAASLASIYRVAGGTGGVATGGTVNGNGGAGGAGAFTIGTVSSGTYTSFSF